MLRLTKPQPTKTGKSIRSLSTAPGWRGSEQGPLRVYPSYGDGVALSRVHRTWMAQLYAGSTPYPVRTAGRSWLSLRGAVSGRRHGIDQSGFCILRTHLLLPDNKEGSSKSSLSVWDSKLRVMGRMIQPTGSPTPSPGQGLWDHTDE